MSTMIELENPEEHAIYNIYLELIDIWMDKMEDMISTEEGNKRIDNIILKMKKSLKTFPHEEFMLKYFFINGEGWKNFHPFKISEMDKEDKQKVIGIRTGKIRFFNPDIEFLNLNIKEGSATEVLQEVLNKTRQYKNVSPKELEEDYTELALMEKTLNDMEVSLEINKAQQTQEEKIMEKLLQNDEVKKIYQNIKEGKTMENTKETEKEEKVEDIKDETEKTVEEDIKEEAEQAEKDIKKEEGLSLTAKIMIGTVLTGITVTACYFLKQKFLK